MIEYELRKLEVNVDEIKKKLKEANAKYIAKKNFRRHVFDVIPSNPKSWIRLRTDGNVTTLSVKEIVSDKIDGTLEWETSVDSFDDTLSMLEKIGVKSRGYQENTRTEYDLDGVQICIDEWPEIPPYLEIEGIDEKSVIKAAESISINKNELIGLNTKEIYKNYGIDLDKKLILKF